MKKIYYSISILALVALVAIPVFIKAETDDATTNTATNTLPAKIRQNLRTDLQERQNEVKRNQDIRNNILENRVSSSTRPNQNASTTWSTSTVPARNGKNIPDDKKGYVNNGRAMLFDVFIMRQRIVAKQLQTAVSNLKNVRDRLQSRIVKAEASGRNMTNAKALLTTADTKIQLAQNAVNMIINLSATSTTATSTATTTIDLNKPRLIASGAQQTIKDAKKALNDVVVAIAKSMGLKLGTDTDRERNNSATSTRGNGRTATSTTGTSTTATSSTATSTGN